MGLGLTWGGGDKQLSAQLPTARGFLSTFHSKRLPGDRPAGLQAEQVAWRQTAWQSASSLGPREEGGPERAQGAHWHFWARSWGSNSLWAWVSSALPEGPQPARSRPSRGNATSTSVPDEWLALASQETVCSNQVQMPSPSHPHPPGQRGRKRERERREAWGCQAR